MKKIAIIGASYLQLPVYLKAQEMGIETIGFAWLEGAVAKDYCTRFYPISTLEKEKILEICLQEQIDGILTIATDISVPTVAYVAEKMKLTSNSYESSLFSTNKYLMRERFVKAGILVPKYFLIEKLTDIQKITNVDFPLIVKPVDRSGSKGITKVFNNEDLSDAIKIALEASLCNKAIVEEFIEGEEISVETISFKGEHYFLSTTDKVTSGHPHFVELEHHQPSKFDGELLDQIISLTKNGLDSLEVKYGASHTELIITKGQIYITEIGARMGGDFIGSELVILSTGFDFLKAVIDVSMGNFGVPDGLVNNFSGIYFLSSETQRLLPFFKEVETNEWTVEKSITNESLIQVQCSADRSGYLIYQANYKIIL